MNDPNSTDPIIPPMESDSSLKDYICPHCDRFLFKGNVKKIHMVCHHCQKMIHADEADLFKSDNRETPVR